MYWQACFTLPILIAATAAQNTPCTARNGDKFYDLTPLSSRDDYKFQSPDGQEFLINVCKRISYDFWNVQVPNPENVAGVTRKARGDFSIGEVNQTILIRHEHPLLVLSGGSPCPVADNMRAMTAVRFICDTSVFAAGSPELVAQLPPNDEDACAFFLEWRTHYACPAGEAAGFWGGLVVALSVFAIIALTVYIVGGTLYKRFVLHRRGFDQVPRISIFSLMDTLDALSSFFDRIIGGDRSRRNHSYTGVSHHYEAPQSPRQAEGAEDEEAGRSPGAESAPDLSSGDARPARAIDADTPNS